MTILQATGAADELVCFELKQFIRNEAWFGRAHPWPAIRLMTPIFDVILGQVFGL